MNLDSKMSKIACGQVLAFVLFFMGMSVSPLAAQTADSNASFTTVVTSDDSTITKRHESGYINFGGDLFAVGGRQIKPVESYDPEGNAWSAHGTAPFEISHYQPVLWGGKFYMIGAFGCCYPDEPLFPDVQIYDPFLHSWSTGAAIPVARLRGSVGAVNYNNKIYLLGGNTLGHNGGAVSWFDEYDPATDTWVQLPDAPNARDHFFAALVGDKLVAASGRTTFQPNPFINTIDAVDVYDFSTGEWLDNRAEIPTPRAGAMVVVYGDEVIVAGGESGIKSESHNEVEAYNVVTNSWRSLQPLPVGTHTGVAGILNDELHVVSGSTLAGGGGETVLHMKAVLGTSVSSDADTDTDGLSDSDEINQYGTDANRPDSDGDTLQDGAEINVHNTNPLDMDTDDDQLNDNLEIQLGTNASLVDTDNDGLQDGYEYAVSGTDPLLSDTDGDGVPDGEEESAATTGGATGGSTAGGGGPDAGTSGGATSGDTTTAGAADSDASSGSSGGAATIWFLAMLGLQGILRRRRA